MQVIQTNEFRFKVGDNVWLSALGTGEIIDIDLINEIASIRYKGSIYKYTLDGKPVKPIDSMGIEYEPTKPSARCANIRAKGV